MPLPKWHLHTTSLRATMRMVPHCAVWLRLLVIALFCVVGAVRPLAQTSNAVTAVQASDPIHISASTREGELTVLRKRGADESSDGKAILVEAPLERLATDCGRFDVGAPRDARPSSAYAEHPRARGPPSA